MYQRPDSITPGVDVQGHPIDPHKMQEHFEDFYEDLFEELNKYGEIESHECFVGNVYVQFREEEQAANALKECWEILCRSGSGVGVGKNTKNRKIESNRINLVIRFRFRCFDSSRLVFTLGEVKRALVRVCDDYDLLVRWQSLLPVGESPPLAALTQSTALRHYHSAVTTQRPWPSVSREPSQSPAGDRHPFPQLPSIDHRSSLPGTSHHSPPRLHLQASLRSSSTRTSSPQRGRPIIVDFSPVTDFREATCRQYEENVCNRGGYCNFMHLKIRQVVCHSMSHSRKYDERDHYYESRSRRNRSTSPGHRRGRSRSPDGRRDPVQLGMAAKRRARIEQWNREKEQAELANRASADSNYKNRRIRIACSKPRSSL
ncbi:hypothetical protein HAX54_043415 [Datura stramonium]|uniref:C3H1-type domain-containing protein n=1 Tax=Datura stramonium TaxID=4076 RepID=A0ABS8SPH0_DATST|nr:hypothetical protein [Datura stramonium]